MRTYGHNLRGTTSVRRSLRTSALTALTLHYPPDWEAVAVSGLRYNGLTRADLLSMMDFFNNYPGHVRRWDCGSFQPVAIPSLSVSWPLTLPGKDAYFALYEYCT